MFLAFSLFNDPYIIQATACTFLTFTKRGEYLELVQVLHGYLEVLKKMHDILKTCLTQEADWMFFQPLVPHQNLVRIADIDKLEIIIFSRAAELLLFQNLFTLAMDSLVMVIENRCRLTFILLPKSSSLDLDFRHSS